MNLKSFSHDQLMKYAHSTVQAERSITTKVIKIFEEIQKRKLYLEYGYPNLYEMAVKHFGYCAGSAMRRINAMRLIREIPAIESKIESGELSLTVAADVQSFFYQEAKRDRAYSTTAKIELLECCFGKSKREVERELVRRNPELERGESVRAVSQDRLRVSFSISEELNQKLNHLRDLLGHVDPNMSLEDLVDRLAELGLDRYDPKRRADRAKARKQKIAQAFEKKHGMRSHSEAETQAQTGTDADADAAAPASQPPPAEVKPKTRYIPAEERHEVKDDGQGCTFTDPRTGRRCGSTRFLQLDHIEPYRSGGPNTATNLRWMCGGHNRWRYQTHVAQQPYAWSYKRKPLHCSERIEARSGGPSGPPCRRRESYRGRARRVRCASIPA